MPLDCKDLGSNSSNAVPSVSCVPPPSSSQVQYEWDLEQSIGKDGTCGWKC